MNKKFIHARLASGPYMNKPNADIFIPRIKFLPDDAKCPVEYQRTQFPIRLDFGITANRSQGKTYKLVGVNLTTELFSHGQLYVSMSRVGTGKNLRIYKPKNSSTFGYMRNVVYPEVLSTERLHLHPENDNNDEDQTNNGTDLLLRLPYHQQKTLLAPKRLKTVGFKETKPPTPEDGNCFIHALKEQMR